MDFLELEEEYKVFKTSKIIVIPVPYEATTSYHKGTQNGPQAILAASQQVENYDIELDFEPCYSTGICTLKPIADLVQLDKKIKEIIAFEKLPVILGGEHSISPRVVAACKEFYPDLTVLQFDAHADLRDSYHERKDSHACAARRILEICPCVQVGIRSLDIEERDYAQKSGQWEKIHFANKIDIDKICKQLSKDVYITFDVDALDPSIVPATGTPEPGGFLWYQTLEILKAVIESKNIVGMDFVELAPKKEDYVSDFAIAKLVYKAMGYWVVSKRSI